jgi:hypothetical protein
MAWKKGESGNPNGKKPGQTARGRFRAQVEAALPEIVDNVLQLARDGDLAATKLILDRCVPALKPTSDAVTIPATKTATLADRGLIVVHAATTGKLSADDAAQVMALLTSQAKLVEQSEVIARLEAIEKWLSEGKK